jgi:hypothetical protein
MTAPQPLRGPYAQVLHELERGLELMRVGLIATGLGVVAPAIAELRELVTLQGVGLRRRGGQ